mmetsp:Transcript_6888/g.8749  ORF Transcript_6888/g.8749 Transcript_6888/m.8749 type:complete len:800 (-) Transcript_6888:30-2429(-)
MKTFSKVLILLVWFWQMVGVMGKRSLSATSLVTCMDNSQISPTYFNVTFNPDDRSLKYSIDLTTEINAKVEAFVQVYAYGFLIIEKTVDMCSLGWKQFCPIYPGTMQVESIEYISEEYVNEIPGIAYTVPDIDAVVKVIVKDQADGKQLSCMQANFTNGKTIEQTGAKWATAVIAGLGLLIAAVLSTFGNSTAATNISANSVSLFLYFQSVVVVSMQHVERVPPIASAWAENLAWSMGLIRIQFMQDIFRWYVQSTGGSPTLYFTGTTSQILVQRALNHLRDVHEFANNNKIVNYAKRSLDFSLQSNSNLIVLRGIERIGYNSHIEPTSIVATGFTFFVFFGYLLVVILIFTKQILDLLIRFKKINPNRLNHFRSSFRLILKGSMLRYLYIGFTQLVILSLWEFTQNDSPALIVLAVILLILVLGVVVYSFWKVVKLARQSIHEYNNPAAVLYGNSKVLNKYGFCYTMFQAEKYWFGIVLIGYNLLKAIFIGLCQYSGKASALVIFIVDLAYTIYLIIQAPYLNKPTNILNYLISVVVTINSFLFLFFSDLFGQPAPVSSIMGWVFFILNAAFSFCLLMMIIAFIAFILISKNPDARFAPARDDRTSFQRMSSVKHRSYSNKQDNKGANELLALGLAAQDHSSNWESEMYKLNNISSSSNDQKNHLTPSLEQEKFEANEINSSENSNDTGRQPQTIGSKLKSKLSRGLSFKAGKSEKGTTTDTNTKNNKITRISDTLLDDNQDNLADEEKDVVNTKPRSFPKDNSATPINQHYRHDSNISAGGFSSYSNNQPTNAKDIL